MQPKVFLNGMVMPEIKSDITLRVMIEKEIEKAKSAFAQLNREKRRNSIVKKTFAVLTAISAMAIMTMDKAEAADPEIANAPVEQHKGLPDIIANSLIDRVAKSGLFGVHKDHTLIWKVNEFTQNHIMNTFNFFDNPSIHSAYTSIWHITMSFTTILLAKKGIDIMRSRILGASTAGISETLFRLFCSIVMTFLSLDVVKLGINLSNITAHYLLKTLESGNIPLDAYNDSGAGIGAFFWYIGYLIMFGILSITYWYRQINLVVLGMFFPVANMAWVFDRGAMLGTLIREVIQTLTTPIAQTLIICLSTIILYEVNTSKLVGGGMLSIADNFAIGVSSIVMMISAPSILRRFITGSFNPFAWTAKMAFQVTNLPKQFLGSLTK